MANASDLGDLALLDFKLPLRAQFMGAPLTYKWDNLDRVIPRMSRWVG